MLSETMPQKVLLRIARAIIVRSLTNDEAFIRRDIIVVSARDTFRKRNDWRAAKHNAAVLTKMARPQQF
jgi:hypothetical protein